MPASLGGAHVLTSILAGGFFATLVLTTMLRVASEAGITRMDLPFLLGTVFTDNRRKAKAWGYVIHFVLGVAFALAYGLFFLAIHRSTWWLGLLVGIVHASFVSAVLVSVLLPVVHPRIGTPETAANEIALVEPPGFLMLNYGRNTVLATLIAHMAYGAIVGWAIRI